MLFYMASTLQTNRMSISKPYLVLAHIIPVITGNHLTPCIHRRTWHIPSDSYHWPLTRYAKLRVGHAPGMPGTFSPPPRVSDPDTHHGTCVTHVPCCMQGSPTSGFLWSRRLGKGFRYTRCMRNPQFYVSGKRPMGKLFVWLIHRISYSMYISTTQVYSYTWSTICKTQ